jgi:mRNA interferase RelE/StbE
VAPLDDPRILAKPLKGSRTDTYWRFRVGDYRIVAVIEDSAERILIVRVAHRRDVYR